MKLSIGLLLAVFVLQSPPMVESQDLSQPWYIKLLQVITSSPDKETLQKNLIHFIDNEKIDGIPFNPSLVKALVMTTDLRMFIEKGVDMNKIFTGLIGADDKIAVVINSIKFDILQQSLNLTAFFQQPNVTDVIRDAGIPPDMLQVVLMNIDYKGFVEAVPIEKVIKLYSLNNNATTMEKAKSLVALIDGKKLVNSIYWKRLQTDENFIKMLDNDFTGSTVDPKLIKAIILSVDLHKLMTKSFELDTFFESIASDTPITEAIVKSIDFNEVFAIFNIETFLNQPNITETLENSKINPNLVKILKHANMSELAKSANLGGIVKAYTTGDNTTRPARIMGAVDKINNAGITKSIEWNKLKLDPSFQALLKDYEIPSNYFKIIQESDFEEIATGIDFKGLAKEMLSNQGNTDFTKLATKYIDIQKFVKAIDLGLLIQSYLKANTSLMISNVCQQAFIGMALPLPSFANAQGFGLLDAAQHPILQLLDSWSKIPPGIFQGHNNWLGGADQCQKIDDAKYCIANMDLSKLSDMLGGGTFGLCLPKSCTEKDGQNILEFFFKEYLTDEIKFQYRPWSANRPLPVNCQKETITYKRGYKVAMAVTGIMLALALIGSFVDEMNNFSKRDEGDDDGIKKEKKKGTGLVSWQK